MQKLPLSRTLIAALLLTAGAIQAADWPSWRGPTHDGVTSETKLPQEWSETMNVKWKAPLPEPGNSTPVISGDKVFLTQSQGDQRLLLCLDRKTGTQLWSAGPKVTEKDPTHATNPYCAASPVTDGKQVIAWFGSAGVYAFDLKGKQLWHRDLGAQKHVFGYASSPTLYKDLCILNFGPGDRSFVVALNRSTGKTVWEYQSPQLPADANWKDFNAPPEMIRSGGPKVNEVSGSWSTPIVAKGPKGDELLINFSLVGVALDPKTGKELWRCRGLGMAAHASAILAGDVAILTGGGFEGSLVAVKLGGRGDITDTPHQLWRKKTRGHLGTGVVKDDLLFLLSENGIAECFDIKTGNILWEERLKPKGPKSTSWASLVRAGDGIYASNQSGEVFRFAADREFKILNHNVLASQSMNASVVAAHSQIFIRTDQNLWCIGL